MFYNDTSRAYTITGVYRVERNGHQCMRESGRDFSSLAVRVRGYCRFESGENTLLADEKSIIYIPRGVGFLREGEKEELIVVHLLCHGEDDAALSVLHATGAEEQFEKLLATWESGAYNRCVSLLYHLFETVEKTKQADGITPPPTIAAGVRHLQEHYRDPALSVSRLAALCHVSEVYFRRVFRSAFGTSPWQEILSHRFSYACALLQSGYYTVKEVASLAGFSDVKYFRTAFSARYGMTPTEFAKKIEQKENGGLLFGEGYDTMALNTEEETQR